MKPLLCKRCPEKCTRPGDCCFEEANAAVAAGEAKYLERIGRPMPLGDRLALRSFAAAVAQFNQEILHGSDA